MKHTIGTDGSSTRRQLLRAAAAGGTAVAAASLLPASNTWADTARGGSPYVKGVDVLPDTSHATDVAAHIQITGRSSIQTYLTKAASVLPYVGADMRVRHVLGSDVGGGYEWTAASGPVPRGITALELDPWGKIERFTAVWNGAYADDTMLTTLAQRAIEQ